MTIAVRTIHCEGRPVAIRISAPSGEGAHWTCRYEIDWPEGMRAMEAAGSDSMQALVIALQMIGIELYASSHHKNGKLSCPGWNGGYGFPVPKSLRDDLAGDDKLYV